MNEKQKQLIKLINTVDETISKLWDSRYDKQRQKLFDIRGELMEVYQMYLRKNK